MDRAVDNVHTMAPALLFLCAGVPLAALLDRLGFFDAIAALVDHRFDRIPVVVLWWLAASTTAVLNLDTTVVLLTPLYLRLARRAGVDPLPVALVPLLLASFASSFLPVSNLTTLIAVDRFDLSVSDVFTHLAPASLVACTVGWLVYRRRYPTVLPGGGDDLVDRRAVIVGGVVVVGVLVGFVAGPSLGVAPWVVALVADLALIGVTQWLPWRDVPLATAAGVAAVAAVVALVATTDGLSSLLQQSNAAALVGTTLLGSAAANATNNIPALFVGLDSTASMTWGMWAWLAGVNTGAVLLPLGALANLLWWRILRAEAVTVTVRSYVKAVLPIAVPALLSAAATLGLTRVVTG